MRNLFVPPGALVVVQADYGIAGTTAIKNLEDYVTNVLHAQCVIVPNAMDGLTIDVLQPDSTNQLLASFGMTATQSPVPATPASGTAPGTVLGSRP